MSRRSSAYCTSTPSLILACGTSRSARWRCDCVVCCTASHNIRHAGHERTVGTTLLCCHARPRPIAVRRYVAQGLLRIVVRTSIQAGHRCACLLQMTRKRIAFVVLLASCRGCGTCSFKTTTCTLPCVAPAFVFSMCGCNANPRRCGHVQGIQGVMAELGACLGAQDPELSRHLVSSSWRLWMTAPSDG